MKSFVSFAQKKIPVINPKIKPCALNSSIDKMNPCSACANRGRPVCKSTNLCPFFKPKKESFVAKIGSSNLKRWSVFD